MFTLVRREFTAALASCAIAAAIAVPGSASAAAPAPNTSPPATVSLLAAGDNGYGALGSGDNTGSSTALPVQVPGVVITHAAAGTYHSVGVTEDGAVFDWGRGANGALGNGLTADSNTPVRVVLPVVARDVAAGDGFSLALTTDGRVFAWGDDEFGQLGNGTIDTGSSTPVPVAFPAGVTVAQISAGEDFALARDTSGVVYAWGDNANGQLGDGTTTTRTAPVPIPLPNGVSALQVAAGSTDGYAVTTANRVLAWGAGAAGQLGDGDTVSSNVPVYVQIPIGEYVASVSGGGGYALGVTTAGAVLAWGGGGNYDLGDGSTANQPAPIAVPFPSGTLLSSVAAAGGFSFAVDTAGHAWAWGRNAYGQLADGTMTTRATPEQLAVPAHVTAAAGGAQHSLLVAAPTPLILGVAPGIVPPAGGTTVVITGTGFTGASVVRFGSQRARITYRSGNTIKAVAPAAAPGQIPVTVTTPGGISRPSTTARLSYVSTGSIIGWGLDYSGSLGNGVTTAESDQAVPVGSVALTGFDFTSLVAGSIASYGLTSDGAIYAWGDNAYGELGNGTLRPSATPVRVALPAGVIAASVVAGEENAYAVTSTGQVYAWGDNESGEIGDGTHRRRTAPVAVALPAGVSVTQVSAGFQYALARTTTGKVYSWGYNGYGQLGDHTTATRTTPVAVHLPAKTSVSQIVAGYYHVLALTSSGQVLGWGDNQSGELGDGTTVSTDLPVVAQLPAGVAVRQLVAHYQFSSLLTTTGAVYDWGTNAYGQLGDGTTTSSTAPVAVALPAGTKVTQLGDGYYTTTALTAAGHVYGWGLNNYGSIGDGTRTVQDTPVRADVPAGVAVTQLHARGSSALAVVRLTAQSP